MREEDFLDYYYKEINYLKNAGAVFAQDFPKIASRLNIDSSGSTDPHVERLIESFAFLTARVNQRIDNVAFDITNALLDVLYPHINKPLPAMSIANFSINTGGNKPSKSGYHLKKNTELFSYASDESLCKFRTVYPITLLPIVIEKIEVISKHTYDFVPVPNTFDFGYKKYNDKPTYFMEITLSCLDESFKDLNLEEFCFHLNSKDKKFNMEIYQAIFSSKSIAYCRRSGENIVFPMLPNSVYPLGFERDEMCIPPLSHETHAYQLIQEYFHFNKKFMFFKLQNLSLLKYLQKGNFLNTEQISVLIPLKDAKDDWYKKIYKDDVLLNCTPIVNLHSVITDPVNIDKKKTFYDLVPDAQRNKTMEIYQIDEVFAVNTENNKEKLLSPYFSFKHTKTDKDEDEQIFWWSKNETIKNEGVTNSNTLISFVSSNFRSIDSDKYISYAKTLCTNRFLAEDIPQGAVLKLEEACPVDSIKCIDKPTFPQYSMDKGENNSKLIAQLSSNYLGFPYGGYNDISDNLKCILKMHMSKDGLKHGESMLSYINSITAKNSMKRVGKDGWRGLIEGVQISVSLDKSDYICEWFLLAYILQRYFSMNCQINTFVDVALIEENIEIAKIENVFGEQYII